MVREKEWRRRRVKSREVAGERVEKEKEWEG